MRHGWNFYILFCVLSLIPFGFLNKAYAVTTKTATFDDCPIGSDSLFHKCSALTADGFSLGFFGKVEPETTNPANHVLSGPSVSMGPIIPSDVISFDLKNLPAPNSVYIWVYVSSQVDSIATLQNTKAGTERITLSKPGYKMSGFYVHGNPEVDNVTATYNDISPPPTPKIFMTGKDITGTTASVIAGQQIQLSAQATGSSIQSQQWNISGKPIGGFHVSDTCPVDNSIYPSPPPCVGSVVQLTSGALSQPSIIFYWPVLGHYSVSLQYKLSDGTTGSVSANFNVSGPSSPSVTTHFGKVIVLNNSVLALSGLADNQGIDFLAKANIPSSIDSKFQWVQIITKDIIYYKKGPRLAKCNIQKSPSALDNMYPYAARSILGNFTADEPTMSLSNTISELKRDFAAQMYAMWKSDVPNSIPVPLGSIKWHMYADAVKNPKTGKWIVKSKATESGVDPFVAGSTYPSWSTVALNSQVTCQ